MTPSQQLWFWGFMMFMLTSNFWFWLHWFDQQEERKERLAEYRTLQAIVTALRDQKQTTVLTWPDKRILDALTELAESVHALQEEHHATG